MSLEALLSIHDVTPRTLSRVKGLIELLPSPCKENLVLLIVPGLPWSETDIDTLRRFEENGFELAGHGWTHHCDEIKGLYHRLHSAMFSRDCGEHLSLTTEEIALLLQKNYNWFTKVGLTAAELYVPPAWALGKISKKKLKQSPYRYFELNSGIYDSKTGINKNLPVIGFEADNKSRKLALRLWNRLNRVISSRVKPLRISIHPYDLELLLKQDMLKILGHISRTLDYRKVVSN